MKFWLVLMLSILGVSISIFVILIRPKRQIQHVPEKKVVEYKTYQNRTYGFRFSYPATYQIHEQGESIILTDGSSSSAVLVVSEELHGNVNDDLNVKNFCSRVSSPLVCTSLQSLQIVTNNNSVTTALYVYNAEPQKVASYSTQQKIDRGPFYVFDLYETSGSRRKVYLVQSHGEENLLIQRIVSTMLLPVLPEVSQAARVTELPLPLRSPQESQSKR